MQGPGHRWGVDFLCGPRDPYRYSSVKICLRIFTRDFTSPQLPLRMNSQSIQTQKKAPGGLSAPGDYSFDGGFLYIILPGEQHPDAIPIQSGEGSGWVWDGDEDRPTLSPSINSVGRWHGWLHAGRLESC